MKNSRSNHRQVLTWMVGASLVLAPVVMTSSAQAQQDQQDQAQQSQPAQQGNWGQAGPPPDAQNGQIPPPPPDAQPSGNPQYGAPPPPPPPDAESGQYPAPPPSYGQPGRAPYQAYPQGNQSQMQQPPSGPVAIPSGTLLQIRLSEPLDTKKVQPGDYFQATVAQSVYQGNVLAIPRGAQVVGRVVDVKKAGDLKGGAAFTLRLTSLSMGGQTYPLASDVWSFNGPGKGGYTAGNAVGGAALGAVIGAIAGGGPGAAIGAAAGTGVGLGASAATPAPRGVLPPESVVAFHLTQPATVQPVSYQEAQELEQNSAPPQPRGYPSGYAPYPAGYGPAPAPYYYPAYPAPYAYAYPYPYVYGGYPYPYGRYYRYRYWR